MYKTQSRATSKYNNIYLLICILISYLILYRALFYQHHTECAISLTNFTPLIDRNYADKKGYEVCILL